MGGGGCALNGGAGGKVFSKSAGCVRAGTHEVTELKRHQYSSEQRVLIKFRGGLKTTPPESAAGRAQEGGPGLGQEGLTEPKKKKMEALIRSAR